jgi:hypothetical protein
VWADARLASLLASVLLDGSPSGSDMAAFLIGKDIQHSGNCETFVRIGTAALECIDHRRTTAIIFGNMVRARFHLSECEALV